MGEGAALAACSLAVLPAEDGDPDAEADLRRILTAAGLAGDRDVEMRIQAALRDFRERAATGTGEPARQAGARGRP